MNYRQPLSSLPSFLPALCQRGFALGPPNWEVYGTGMQIGETNLLTSLHEGIFEQPLWGKFLDRLRAHTRTKYVTIVFRPDGAKDLVELVSGALPLPEHLRQIIRANSEQGGIANRSMREGRVYGFEELIDVSNPRQLALLDQVLRPSGINHGRIIRVADSAGFDAWLGCAGGNMNNWSSVSATLSQMAPHFRIALASLAKLERYRFRSKIMTETFQHLDFGWLALDQQIRVLDMSPNMPEFLERSPYLRLGHENRLAFDSSATNREVRALLKSFATNRETRPEAVNLGREPHVDMLVQPIRERMLSTQTAPIAIAYFRGDRPFSTDPSHQLVHLFGLTPSEARFAWLMAKGLSIAQSAEKAGLSLETARSYSKKIYAKTGVRGQAELVRSLLASVLAVA